MIPNPHDLLFKGVFGQPEHARGMLRTILPAVLAEVLDGSALTLQPGSFVDAALSSRHTDLLYSTTWHDGGEALVYLLFEHQSSPPTDGLMAERLLHYQGRIWDRWRVDHPKAKRLPMILPIVMYHGTVPWLEPRSFDALLDVPDRLRSAVQPYLVRFEYVLHDLSEISEGAQRADMTDVSTRTSVLGASLRVLVADQLMPSLLEPRDVALGLELHGVVERAWSSRVNTGDDPAIRYGLGLATRLRGGGDDDSALRFWWSSDSAQHGASASVNMRTGSRRTRRRPSTGARSRSSAEPAFAAIDPTRPR
jgi:Putative transposase, YhgA-like